MGKRSAAVSSVSSMWSYCSDSDREETCDSEIAGPYGDAETLRKLLGAIGSGSAQETCEAGLARPDTDAKTLSKLLGAIGSGSTPAQDQVATAPSATAASWSASADEHGVVTGQYHPGSVKAERAQVTGKGQARTGAGKAPGGVACSTSFSSEAESDEKETFVPSSVSAGSCCSKSSEGSNEEATTSEPRSPPLPLVGPEAVCMDDSEDEEECMQPASSLFHTFDADWPRSRVQSRVESRRASTAEGLLEAGALNDERGVAEEAPPSQGGPAAEAQALEELIASLPKHYQQDARQSLMRQAKEIRHLRSVIGTYEELSIGSSSA